MQPYGQQPQYQQEVPQQQQQGPQVLETREFLSRVQRIREQVQDLRRDVGILSELHAHALNSPDQQGQAKRQVDSMVAETQMKNTSIRNQIQQLKTDTEHTQGADFGLKKRQFETINGEYKNLVASYLEEEKVYQERYRQQIARQYRIVNENASDQEVEAAMNADWGNEGVFQSALATNRTGQATRVLGAVRARHNELQQIEKSIVELAQLFQDLDTLVVQQGEVIQATVVAADQAHDHLEQGNQEVIKGIEHAGRYRRLKWWCLLVAVLIIIAIVLGVVLGVVLPNINKNKTS
ncbi:putative snare domain-protein [Diplogelasinospora grovesii]|uniref:Snare domain-protein n=1 Tax=Diplogelasinospora grovesii TaxID=303347 RepID=A0AAN6NAS7_9PEZI|nr:putative snare domain-protein [Diplogelasinospora grovesii]